MRSDDGGPGGSDTVRVACAQLLARDLGDGERALEDAVAAVAEAASAGADLVVLPECTYPAYLLADPRGAVELRADADVENLFITAAREHGIWLAVGIAQRWRPGTHRAVNAALLVSPDGDVRMRTSKRFLWDFDRRWFTPGEGADPVPWARSTGGDLGAIGMLVCADARMPEIARSLAVLGARLILDPTAWVATGREPASLSNPQPEYLLSVRALENGVWIAAADKAGVERSAVVYAGRSCIVAPDGTVVAMASAEEPELVWADIDLSRATGPPIPRRPELYGTIAGGRSTRAAREATERADRPVVAGEALVRIGLLQATVSTPASEVEGLLARTASTTEALGIRLVVAAVDAAVPDLASLAELGRQTLATAVVLGGVDGSRRVVGACGVAEATSIVASRTHGEDLDPDASLEGRTLDVGLLRVGAIVGPEGLAPEVPRILALGGAELIVWIADADTPLALEVARVRSVENRVWTAVIVPPGSRDPISALVDPEGRVTAVGVRGRDQLVVGTVNVITARQKEMAPGTHVLTDRQPAAYDVLAASVTTP
jgi:predicted amidohydrolase